MGWLLKYRQTGGYGDMLDMVNTVTTHDSSPANLILGLLGNYMKQRGNLPMQYRQPDNEMELSLPDIHTQINANPAIAYNLPDFIPAPTQADQTAPPRVLENYSNVSPANLDKVISKKESGGNYRATNPYSSATGKYQFLWNTWKDSIRNITGVRSREDFLNNPLAQENYFKWYSTNILAPAVNRIKRYNNRDYTDTQLSQLIHFKGEKGAREWLENGIDRTQAHNAPIDKYLKGQSGIAVTRQQQYEGLNNPLYDELFFTTSGINLFRGLDNNQPVQLTDSTGKTKILTGPHETANMQGHVFEKRVNGNWLDKYK